eukprot:gene44982-55990_t
MALLALSDGAKKLMQAKSQHMSPPLMFHLGPRLSLPWLVAPEDGCRIIGEVTRGQEMGQLAITPDGQYVQVNGSMVQPLNASRVLAALRKAARQQNVNLQELMPRAPQAAPVVIVRKKRRIVVKEQP